MEVNLIKKDKYICFFEVNNLIFYTEWKERERESDSKIKRGKKEKRKGWATKKRTFFCGFHKE